MVQWWGKAAVMGENWECRAETSMFVDIVNHKEGAANKLEEMH